MEQYTDLRTLKDGTAFYVKNGHWTGYVFVKNGDKYMHIDETGQDKLLNGDEGLVIRIKDAVKQENDKPDFETVKNSIETIKTLILSLQEESRKVENSYKNGVFFARRIWIDCDDAMEKVEQIKSAYDRLETLGREVENA